MALNSSVVVSGADALASEYNDLRDDVIQNAGEYAVTAGGTTAYTLSIDAAYTAYTAGDVFRFKMNATNTGSSTLNVNSIGAKTIKIDGRNVTSGELVSGVTYDGTYDGTDILITGPSAIGFVSNARAYINTNAQVAPSGTEVVIRFNAETYDEIGEFDSTVTSGTTTGTTSSKLVDSGASFGSDLNGAEVWNTTDNTYSYVTAVDSGTTLSLNDNIFVSGENYEIYWSKFTATTAGKYLVVTKGLLNTPTDQALSTIKIRKNGNGGTVIGLKRVYASGTSGLPFIYSDIVDLAANDYIQVTFTQSMGSNKNISNGETNTFFTIHRLS